MMQFKLPNQKNMICRDFRDCRDRDQDRDQLPRRDRDAYMPETRPRRDLQGITVSRPRRRDRDHIPLSLYYILKVGTNPDYYYYSVLFHHINSNPTFLYEKKIVKLCCKFVRFSQIWLVENKTNLLKTNTKFWHSIIP